MKFVTVGIVILFIGLIIWLGKDDNDNDDYLPLKFKT